MYVCVTFFIIFWLFKSNHEENLLNSVAALSCIQIFWLFKSNHEEDLLNSLAALSCIQMGYEKDLVRRAILQLERSGS